MDPETLNNRYRIVKELGHGGMGRVCLVEDLHNDCQLLALKTLLVGEGDERASSAFMEEFGGLVKLRHPNLAAAYDFGLIAGTAEHFFTTEFIRGVELFPGTEEATVDQLLDIVAQVLRGLDFLHDNALLHNDLKPANILLAAEAEEESGDEFARLEKVVFGVSGQVKIIDFGLLSAENVSWQNIRGTPQYISPERIRCRPADRRSDLYSIGCVFYHLAAREMPFRARTIRDILQLQLQRSARPLGAFRADLPAPFVDMVGRLMEKDPGKRFQSARETLRFLGEGMGWDGTAVEVQSKTPEVTAGSLLFRDQEYGVLQERFDRATEGNARESTIVVSGPTGVGKSRLVEELRGVVQIAGGAFVDVAGVAVEGHLEPVLTALMGALKTGGVAGLDPIENLVSSEEDGGDGKELAWKLQQVIFLFARQMPIVFHFDDFQAASKVIRHFVLEMAGAAREELEAGGESLKLLVIISERDDGEIRERDTKLGSHQKLLLRPFDTEQSRSFLQRVYGQEEIPEGVLGPLTGVARGIPTLLLELARDLVRRKLVKYAGTRWSFPPSLEGVSLPQSFSAVLESKLDDLNENSRTVLEWVALCHSPVSTMVLEHCTYFEEQRLTRILEGLTDGGFLTFEEIDGKRRYSFSNRDTKLTVAKGLDDEARVVKHQRLAQCLESVDGDEGQLAELLAYHWNRVGNNPAFLRYAPAAALHLQKCGNFELAAEYHRRLVECMPANATARKIQSLLKLSEMHEFVGQLERVEDNVEEILRLGAKLLKPKDRGALLRRLAGLEMARHDHAAALAHLWEARTLIGDDASDVERFSLMGPEAWAAWFSDNQERGWIAHAEADRMYDQLDPQNPRELLLVVGSSHHLANLHVLFGNLERAIHIYRRNLELAAKTQRMQALAASYCSLGSVLLAAGEPREALEHLDKAVELGRELGDLRVLCRARERLGEYHCLHGELKTAFHVIQLGLEDARTLQHLGAMGNAMRVLGRIYLRSGQADEAIRVLDTALGIQSEGGGDPSDIALTEIYLARLYVATGRSSEAKVHLASAREVASTLRLALVGGTGELLDIRLVFEETRQLEWDRVQEVRAGFAAQGFRHEAADAGLLGAHVALELGDAEELAIRLADLGEELEEIGSWKQRAELDYLRARLQLVQGDRFEAFEALRNLEKRAKTQMLPGIRAQCRQVLAEVDSVEA